MKTEESHKRFQQVFWILFLLIIVLSPNIYLYLKNLFILKFSFSVRILIRVLFVMNLFAIPLFIKGINVRTYFYLLSPLILISPFAFVPVALYDFLPSKWIILGVLQTNSEEALEFIRGLEWVVIVILILFIIYIGIVRFLTPVRLDFSLRTRLRFFGVTLFFFIVIVGWTISLHGIRNISSNLYNRVLVLSYPVGLIHNSILAYSEIERFQFIGPDDFIFHAYRKDTLKERKISILILGESSRYANWGINGYVRNTSPHLSANQNVITFSNMISPAPLTGLSLPIILTRATPENSEVMYAEKSFLSAFREAGYKVHWISNQPAEPSTIKFITEADSYINLAGKDKFDEDLLPLLKAALDSGKDDLLIIIHTLGSHYNYANRFPEKFNIYTPSTLDKSKNSKSINDRQLIINSYDNSILYTDHIINEVIKLVDQPNLLSTVLYLSDHGEIIFDDNLKILGHGVGTPSTYVHHIPLFVWTSDRFQFHYQEVVATAKAHKDAALSSTNFFHSFLDLNKIYVVNEKLDESFFSKSLKLRKRKVMLREDELIDYDSIP